MPPEPEQLWNDVSIDYGCVTVAPHINAAEEETASRHDKGEDGNNLKGEHQKSTSGDIIKKEMLMAEGKIDGSVEEGSERERVPLVSGHTSQTDQSDCLPDDYGVLRPATVDGTEKADGEQAEEEQEAETTFIHWNPNSRKIWLPETVFPKEAGLDWLLQGEKDKKNGVEEEKEDMYTARGKVLLENVFVRQSSEEEAEAKRALERGGNKGLGLDDLLNKWELVISMDE